MSSQKTIILAALPNRLTNIGNFQENLQNQSPAFRKTIVPGGPGKSLLGIRPAVTTLRSIEKPVSIEIKLENQLMETDQESQATRKRQRLDHLTIEEKLMRRKLKNRVAAQTARDRKKARMDELEDMVSHLEKQVDNLRSDNSRLKNITILLETENKYLKEKLEVNKDAKSVSDVSVKKEVIEDMKNEDEVISVEHAWPISAPLQKEQELTTPLSRWTKPSVYWKMIIMTLMIYMTSYNSATKTCSTAHLMKLLGNLKGKRVNHLVNDLDAIAQWWGPQQKSWNPSKS